MAKSQQIYFPKSISADTTALEKFMPVMSKDVMDKINRSKPQKNSKYYEHAFNLDAVAGQYQKTGSDIDTLRHLRAKELGIPEDDTQELFCFYEVYAFIRTFKQTRSPEGTLKQWFASVQYYLKGKAASDALEPFKKDEATVNTDWQHALTTVQAAQGDSISIDEALSFAQAYLQHSAYQYMGAAAKKALAHIDNNNFVIQDSTMITMHDGVKIAAVIVRSKSFSGPLPVVMMGNIYATTQETQMAKDIAVHGYVGVIVNTRGKYVSDVMTEPWEHDASDLYDAID